MFLPLPALRALFPLGSLCSIGFLGTSGAGPSPTPLSVFWVLSGSRSLIVPGPLTSFGPGTFIESPCIFRFLTPSLAGPVRAVSSTVPLLTLVPSLSILATLLLPSVIILSLPLFFGLLDFRLRLRPTENLS